jgi:methyl-accepting chemotaxis protein
MVRKLARLLTALSGTMLTVARGTTDVSVPGIGRSDEIGGMAEALETFCGIVAERADLERRAAADLAAKDKRQEAMDRHTEDFATTIAAVLTSFTQAGQAMNAAARAAAEAALDTQSRAAATTEQAEASRGDLARIASATEELSASIDEIGRRIGDAAAVMRDAVAGAGDADERVRQLGEAAGRIGEIVRLIETIASQTNLLALNATIEAARAGEAGKGFAVVAGEVKALAQQTAKATEEIAEQIAAISAATTGAITAVQSVSGTIGRMDTITGTIETAISQQAAATREIAASVQSVVAGTTQVLSTMHEVAAASDKAEGASRQSSEAATQVSEQASALHTEVCQFLAALRTMTGEHRSFERAPGNGLTARLTQAGGEEAAATVIDISVGGAALACPAQVGAGTAVALTFPGGRTARARVARTEHGRLIVTFALDAANVAVMEQVMASLGPARALAA